MIRICRLDFDKGVEIKSDCGLYFLNLCEEKITTQDGVNRYQCEGEKFASTVIGPGTTTADVMIKTFGRETNDKVSNFEKNAAQSVFNKLFIINLFYNYSIL